MGTLRPTITEATAERMADRIIMSRLSTDRAYKNAESAETQASRELAIECEVWDELEAKYEIGD